MNEWILVRRCHWFLCELYFAEFCDWVSCTLSYVIEYGQKFQLCSNVWSQTLARIQQKKQTNQNKQMPAAMKVEFFTQMSVYRPYHWTVFRSEFPGFAWPVKSCVECHSPFISFITDQNSHGFISLWVVSLTSARINAIASLCHHL